MNQHPIFQKIEEKTVTAEDFNILISEASPEAVRDRIRRRVITPNIADDHLDKSGHQKLSSPEFTKRVQPKKKRNPGTQMNGQGKAAHRRSTRTQQRKAEQTSVENKSKRFKLNFNEVKFTAFMLKEMLDARALVPNKDYVLDEDGKILQTMESFQFDDELKKFLIEKADVQRADTKVPDLFDYVDYNSLTDGIDPKELSMGIEVEREHNSGDTDVVSSYQDLVKIAVAHLREDPKYYTKLKSVGL